MKRLMIFMTAVCILIFAYPLTAAAQDINIECESIVRSDRAFDLDIVFSHEKPLKGGSAVFIYDEGRFKVSSVRLLERESADVFKYNDKGGSIAFSFNSFTGLSSRTVRIRLSPLEKYERESCGFEIKDGCICTDSSSIFYCENTSPAEITLVKELPKAEDSQHGGGIEGSGANIVYIEEKSSDPPVTQSIFLSIIGIAAAAAGLLMIFQIFRKKVKK